MLCQSVRAEVQYGYNVWTVDDGLPQNSIRGVTQTPDGYIWISTFDGLVRFDGVRFSLFNKGNTNGIDSNRFSNIVQGTDGDLWLPTDGGGLTRYHDGSFRTYGTEHGIVNGTVRGIAQDPEGDLWILSGNSIERWDKTNERFVDITPKAPRLIYNPFEWDNAGFWAIDKTTLHCFMAGRSSSYTLPSGLGHIILSYAALDQRGKIWLETADGKRFSIQTGGAGEFRRAGQALATEYVDRRGHVWKIHIGPRLTRTLDFVSSNRVIDVAPTHLYEDRQQNLWIATEGQGLYELQPQSIRSYSKEQGLVDRDVFPIYQDHSGAVWIGAWHAGISRFSDDKFTSFTVRDGLPNGMITAIYEDREGRLWTASHGGLSVFEHGRFRRTDQPNLPVVAQAILEDRMGTLWFGTERGLVSYKDGVSRLYTTQDGLPTNDIRVLMESATGDLWMGGYGGLARFHQGRFTRWTENNELPSKNVWSLYEDPQGVLWIGTYDGGLARYKDGKLTLYNVKNGLYSDGVYQILEDDHGYFWISCSRGIYRVSKRELNEVASGIRSAVTSVASGKIDGMLDLVCNGGLGPGGIRTRDGKMWFPTQDGVAVIDPDKLAIDSQPPPVLIESGNLDRRPIPVTGSLRIPPGKRSLEIQYTALSFIKPEQVRFRYQMQGLDSGWIDAGARRTAYYSDLPAGNYVFRVVAANADGIWNRQGRSLTVIVLAPFYKRWWFLSLIVLIFGGIIVGISQFRIAQHRRAREVQQAFSQQLIASQESERKRIAAELHDSLGQRLVVIHNLALFSLKESDGVAASAGWKQAAKEISAEAVSAIGETRSISYNLRPFQLDRLGLRKAIEGLAQTVERASGVRVSSKIDDIDELFPEELRINFYRILQEGLQNMVKHAHATEANIRIEHLDSTVTVAIADNGQGFMPGHRVDDPSRGGFGLTGMAERAALLGGTFKVYSANGHGTMITIDIPLKGPVNGGPDPHPPRG